MCLDVQMFQLYSRRQLETDQQKGHQGQVSKGDWPLLCPVLS